VQYPLGHRRRRAEGTPLLARKFAENLATRFDGRRCEQIVRTFTDVKSLDAMPVDEFLAMFV
jgi:2-methylcitrate dehydratase